MIRSPSRLAPCPAPLPVGAVYKPLHMTVVDLAACPASLAVGMMWMVLGWLVHVWHNVRPRCGLVSRPTAPVPGGFRFTSGG